MEEKMKKRMKTWEKILIIILLLLLIFAINTYRKFSVIRAIDKQCERDLKSNNFYQKTVQMGEKTSSITEMFHYGSKEMLKTTTYEEKGKVERILYKDNDKKESWIIVNRPDNKDAVQIDYMEDVPVAVVTTHTGITSEEWGIEILTAIRTKMTSGNWRNEDCYHIKWGKELEIWVDKESKRVIGEKNGYTTTTTGETLDNITTYYYKENQLTAEDVEMPELSSYQVKDARG